MESINKYLLSLSKDLSFSTEEKEKIKTSYDYLEGKIFETFRERIEKVKIFGSFERNTALPQRIDGKTDVDVMVVFRKKEYQPDTFLKHLREFADKIYPRSQVSPDHPAITVEFHHTKFELVPGYWEHYIFSSELNIPAPKMKEVKWIPTDPDGYFSTLKEKDRKNNGLIIPLIKILKYINSKHNYAYNSSVIERFVINCGYWGDTLAEKLFEVIDAMDTSNQTAIQIEFVNELKQRKKNLLALVNANLDDYIKIEMEKLLPSIKY